MKAKIQAIAAFLLLLMPAVFPIDVLFFYANGCPHCAITLVQLEKFSEQYGLNVVQKEVYQNRDNANELFTVAMQHNIDPTGLGVPFTLVGNRAAVVGSMDDIYWQEILDKCVESGCPAAIYTAAGKVIDLGQMPEPQTNPLENISSKLPEQNTTNATSGAEDSNQKQENGEISTTGQDEGFSVPFLIGAALADSINPCTIAVMVMLLGVIIMKKGKGQTLVAGLLFSVTIFAMYLIMGLGVFTAITTAGLTALFFAIVTLGALVLSLMEFNAYLNYKPGFMAVEMPMFLRPHAKKVTGAATSPLGVVLAAVFCSLFLIPCSSGPYLMVLGMLAKSMTAQTLGYLVLYNLIFVLPMVLITIAIYFGRTTVEKIGEAKEKYIRRIHLISGAIFFILFLFMLSELLRLV